MSGALAWPSSLRSPTTRGTRTTCATVLAGVIDGAVMLTAVGAVLGLDAGKVWKGLPRGALAGVAGALVYYLLVAMFGRRAYASAIPAAWVTLWLIVAALDGRCLRSSRLTLATQCPRFAGNPPLRTGGVFRPRDQVTIQIGHQINQRYGSLQ